jgi:hypothetical protein
VRRLLSLKYCCRCSEGEVKCRDFFLWTFVTIVKKKWRMASDVRIFMLVSTDG